MTWPNWSANRVRLVRQSEAAECGIACVAMILSHYGKHVDLRTLRSYGGTSLKGSTLHDLSKLATTMGLAHRAVKVELFALPTLMTPAILHWDMNHFVVLEKSTAKYAYIVDPASGRRRIGIDELSKHFTGVALECSPLNTFVKENANHRLRWRDIIRRVTGLKRQAAVILVFSMVTGLISLAAPQYIQYAIDHAVLNQDSSSLVILAVGFTLLLLFGLAVSMLQSFSVLHLTTILLFQFRQNLFHHLLFLPSKYFESRSVGDVISRMDSYESIQDSFTVETFNAIIQIIIAIIIIILLFFYSWKIVLIVLGYFFLSIFIGLSFFPFQRRRIMDAIVAKAYADSKSIEAVRGHQSIKALGIEKEMLDHWGVSQADAVNAGLLPSKLSIWQSLPMGVLDIANQIAIPAFTLYLVIENELTLGMFYAVNAYKSQFTAAMNSLVHVAFGLAFNGIHLERLSDIALEPPEQPIVSFDRSDHHSQGSTQHDLREIKKIDLANGAFRYAKMDPYIFEDISLTVNKGERISLIGSSGCGKTTLLKVLNSLLMPTKGELRINDQILESQNLASYRSRIGMVMQNDVLFAGSIALNVARCSAEVDVERVVEACQIADIHDQIQKMPMQYDTLIGDMGSALSTGQKQRVILARALYSSPDFLFLDEGTAHLDQESERRILSRLQDLDLGIVFVVHNEAALQVSDRVYRLENGGLSERSHRP